METRRDYIKAAILNDREIYGLVMSDARCWNVCGFAYKVEACCDVVEMYGDRIKDCFPWLHMMRDEIMNAYNEVVEEAAAELEPELFSVKCGSAIMWDSLHGMYLVCDNDNCGKLRITNRTSDIATAEDICVNRAGICNPVGEENGNVYPMSPISGELDKSISLHLN